MPYVVLLKSGSYLGKNEKSGQFQRVGGIEKAHHFINKNEACYSLRILKETLSSDFETGTVRKIKNK